MPIVLFVLYTRFILRQTDAKTKLRGVFQNADVIDRMLLGYFSAAVCWNKRESIGSDLKLTWTVNDGAWATKNMALHSASKLEVFLNNLRIAGQEYTRTLSVLL
jgi:hypothetical protein